MTSTAKNQHYRTVNRILPAYLVDMQGVPIHQPLPGRGIDFVDPFLLLHHLHAHIQPGANSRELGVGPHPHRGFAPVTFIYKGDVHHRDSRGNNSIVRSGGIQWLQAGMGIVHSERPSAELAEQGGEQEIIQLWINTPGIHKLDQPLYVPMQEHEIPELTGTPAGVRARIIAGQFQGQSGLKVNHTPLIILDATLEKDAIWQFDIPSEYHVLIYNLDDRIDVEAFGLVDARHMVWFRNDHETIRLAGKEETRILILAGIPLNEPVQTYGPFVMNNQTEIMQAIRDYQMGKMGVLIEE